MTIIYNNEIQDSKKEIEIKVTDETLTAVVTDKSGNIEIFTELTEVHYLFPNHFETEACAFESDIQSDGRTRDLKHLASIVIFNGKWI